MATPTRAARGAHHARPNLAATHDAQPRIRMVWGLTRIALGLVFLWDFLDRLLGLGLSTPSEAAWVRGGSPTRGFLGGAEGWLSGAFNAMAGNPLVDALFMAGLLGVGLALVLGVGVRVAAASGALMMLLIWLASLPLRGHPFVDYHVVYALVLVGLALDKAGHALGLGRWWTGLDVVRRNPWLE
jgi:thiosulfate dehydrogenase [quinone] large subunit